MARGNDGDELVVTDDLLVEPGQFGWGLDEPEIGGAVTQAIDDRGRVGHLEGDRITWMVAGESVEPLGEQVLRDREAGGNTKPAGLFGSKRRESDLEFVRGAQDRVGPPGDDDAGVSRRGATRAAVEQLHTQLPFEVFDAAAG